VSRIAYFGPQGTFTEQAARTFVEESTPGIGAAPEMVPLDTVPDVLDAVRVGGADAGCVPVENSVEGAVPATMDSLVEGEPLIAVGEAVLAVRFSVLVRPGSDSASIATVASHPHALAQVRGWLAEHLPRASAVATTSTAAAAVAVRDGQFDAAVTAPVAATHYPLQVLATDVADVRDAMTRFLLLRRPPHLSEPTGADRTSAVLVVADRPGELAMVLTEFALRGINLSRIESRPLKGRLGAYRFYLDFDGHVTEPRVGDALAALHRRSTRVRFLGSYPRADRTVSPAAPNTDAADYAEAAEWLARVRAGGPG